MDNNWVFVYSSNQLYEVQLVKEILEDNEIDTFVLNKQSSSYLIGDIELYTRPDDVLKAKLIIEKFEN